MSSEKPADPTPSPNPVAIPTAVIAPRSRFSVIWMVPVVAALLAGYLFYRTVLQAGPIITIRFEDGTGLKNEQTTIKYLGITVGDVRHIRLSKDQQAIEVEARLDKSAAFLAREGSVFWIVRPEITTEGVRGLGTIFSGSHIQVNPGSGKPQHQFIGAQKRPITTREGLKLVLMSGQLKFIKPGSIVSYRGIEVGEVEKVDLATNARTISIYISIHKPYVALVRPDTRFWNAGGVDVNFSLFGGLEFTAETFKALIGGGVAFATPDTSAHDKPPPDGMLFRLYDKPEDAWLKWSPTIELPGQ